MPDIPPVTIRSISGLWSSPNPFSKVPEGALALADECVIRANGVLEPRRGYGSDATAARTALYQVADNRVIAINHAIPSDMQQLAISANGATQSQVNALGGSPLTDPHPYANDPRVVTRFATANQTVIATFQHGPQTSTVQASYDPNLGIVGNTFTVQRLSGLPRPPAPALALIAAAGNAVIVTGKRRTFRVTVAMYDSAGNFYESPPSEPVYIENSSGGDRTIQITLYWPQAMQSWNPAASAAPSGGYLPFFRIWRALETAVGTSANDEMALTREYVPASYTFAADGFLDPAVSFTFNDVSVDALLNVPLYTNPQTGDGFGILSANKRPPAAGAVAYFKGRAYYLRCSYQQTLSVQIIGTGTGGVAPGDTVTIDGITYTAGGVGLEATGVFNCPTGAGAVASNIETTARSLVECIRQAYASGTGRNRQVHRKLTATYASISANNDYGRIVIERPLPVSNGDDSAIVFSVVTVSPGIRFPGGSTQSADDYVPGGLSWSKPDQPEAVPDVNFEIVGDANRAGLGFSVHRDSMIIYKEDGAYILRDDGGPQPTIDLLDASVVCIAPATIAVVSNLAYALCQRGVLQVSEQGTELMSFPIWEDLDKLYRLHVTQLAPAFAVAHESERLYILALPASAQETTCSVQYVLRVPESESPLPKWTRWNLPGVASGCVVAQSNQLVFGQIIAPGLLIETRGGIGSLDYCDIYATQTFNAPASPSAGVTLAGDKRSVVGTGDLLTYNPGGVGTKVYTPRVVAVAYASGATTLTLDRTVPFAGGTFTTIPAIRAHWRFVQITAGEPTYEKQFSYVQGYFSYFDGDWLDAKLDTEASPPNDFSRVYSDPQRSNLGGEIALSYTGAVQPNPVPSAPLSSIPWLRSCRDVLLRIDPAKDESRGARLGIEMQFAQAQASFRLAAVSAVVGEANEVGNR